MNGASRTLCNRARAGAAAALAGVLAGCGHLPHPHLSWPWHHKAAAAPEEVHELTITPGAPGGSTAFPQYWKRNTLLVDLQSAGGTGSVVLQPVAGTPWPVRLGFRVLPGRFGMLEVHGDQRKVLPVTAQGTKPLDLELEPGVYSAKTPQITVTWEPASAPAE